MKSVLFILLCLPLVLVSQEKQFSIAVSRDTVLMGNTIKVEFTLKNIQGNFEGPEFEDFDVLMGPNSSSSYSNINGKVTNSSKYTYIIKPKEEGEFFIENAYVVDKREEENSMQTEPFKIVVLSNPDGIIEEDTDTGFNTQIFQFSWPNDISKDIFSDEKEEKEKENSKPKRKIKKI